MHLCIYIEYFCYDFIKMYMNKKYLGDDGIYFKHISTFLDGDIQKLSWYCLCGLDIYFNIYLYII